LGTHWQVLIPSAKPLQQLFLPPFSRVPFGMHAHVPLFSFPLQQLEPWPGVPAGMHAHVPDAA
jgi:hypothetical protein